MKSNAKGLYIHIPFCRNICTYCDFKKFIYNQKRVDDYFKSLFLQCNTLKEKKYRSIYIGGGTPSCIDKSNLISLLQLLSKHLYKNYEFSIECNVEDINEELLKILKDNKINRLSIGIQTFNEKYIRYFNRHHNKQMAVDNIKLASKYFKNISIDMIFAINNQTIKELKEDINTLVSLPITHVSYYSLLIEENTVLCAKKVLNVNDDMQAKMYTLINKELKKYGFIRYEISSFAKHQKYQSYHNKLYWENKHYDALGLAASGYIYNIRYTNNTNINTYIQNNFTLSEKNTLSKEDIMFDEIMLNLRLDKGIDINKFNKKFNVSLLDLYKEAITKNINNNLLIKRNGKIKTTFKGSLLLNSILVDFLN